MRIVHKGYSPERSRGFLTVDSPPLSPSQYYAGARAIGIKSTSADYRRGYDELKHCTFYSFPVDAEDPEQEMQYRADMLVDALRDLGILADSNDQMHNWP